MPFNTACQLDKEGRTLLPECLVNCFIVAQIGENAYSCILLIQTINVCFEGNLLGLQETDASHLKRLKE